MDLRASPYTGEIPARIDDVIEARTTRPQLVRWLELLRTKLEPRPRRKHGNVPL